MDGINKDKDMPAANLNRWKSNWHYGWVISANGFFVEMVVMGTALYSYSVFVLPFARTFETGTFPAMLGLAGLQISIATFSPVAGYLITRGSAKIYMILGMALLGIGFWCMSYASAIWHIVAIYVLFIGFGYAFVAPIGASALITNWFITLRGRALSLAAMGTSFGGFIIPPLAAYIISYADWRMAFQAFGALFFIISIPLTWWLVVDKPEQMGLLPYGVREDEVDPMSTKSELVHYSLRTLLVDKYFWLIALSLGSGFAVFMGVTANIVPYATTLGYSEQQGALFLSGITICALIGKIIFAIVTDRLGVRNTFWAALIFNMIGMAFLILMPTYITLFISVICVGLSSGGLLISWPGFIGFHYGRDILPKVMGLSAPIVNGSMMLLPPFAGLMFDLFGDYRIAFVLFFSVLVLGMMLSRNVGKINTC